jgi:ArsR family transcriptional regulator, virulence genes transcriptional regulator
MDAAQRDGTLERHASEQAKYCRVFSNATRVQILWTLADGELSVGAIAEAVGTSMQNISQHLSMMKSYNIVSARRDGQTIYYRIDRDVLAARCLSLLHATFPDITLKIET